jgi:hypothetical protein
MSSQELIVTRSTLLVMAAMFWTTTSLAQQRPLDELGADALQKAVRTALAAVEKSKPLCDVEISPEDIEYQSKKLRWVVKSPIRLNEKVATEVDAALRQLLKDAVRRANLLGASDVGQFDTIVVDADIQIVQSSGKQAPTPGTTHHDSRKTRATVLEPPLSYVPLHVPCELSWQNQLCERSSILGSVPAAPLAKVAPDSIILAAERYLRKPTGLNEANLFANVSVKTAEREAPDDRARSIALVLFGEGCHAYWRGDYRSAISVFGEAIRRDADDARFWYFKGLSEVALGELAATDSFGHAVALEAEGKPDARQINAALERVQGSVRQQLRAATQRARLLSLPRSPSRLNQDESHETKGRRSTRSALTAIVTPHQRPYAPKTSGTLP